MRITTLIDARRYRGRRVRLSAMTRVPPFADRVSQLVARSFGSGGPSAEADEAIGASEGWRRHSLDFAVPRNARAIEIGFVVHGMSGQLDADVVRLEIRR